jgi:cell division septal protein FtsQ
MSKIKHNVRRRAGFDDGDSANFIRNRTLSGYDPSGDTAAEEAVLERSRQQNRSSKKRRWTTILLAIGVVVSLIVLLISQFVVSVSSVEYAQSGVSTKRDNEYLAFANQYLDERPSQRLLWAINGEELLAAARTAYPEIAEISVNNNLISGGSVKVSLRSPVAVWSAGGKRSYVDQHGVVFETNYFDEPDITIVDQNTSQSGGVSSRMLEFIGKTIAGLESSSSEKVREISIPAQAARYVEIKLHSRDFYIKVQIDRDITSQITDIVNMIKFLDERGIKPSYIDVRVKNRGYYR